jgi:hypothetical protein
VLADFIDGADVGVIQSRGSARFALEAFEGLVVAGNIVGQELQCHTAAEAEVFSFIDHTHPATTEFFQDAIVGDRLPGNRARVRHERILGRARGQVNARWEGRLSSLAETRSENTPPLAPLISLDELQASGILAPAWRRGSYLPPID